MIGPDEAWDRIAAESRVLPGEWRSLAAARGRRLADSPVSDTDVPPYDKSLVDGYAVRSQDLPWPGPRRVVDEILAGSLPRRSIGPGDAARIMTGAPLPAGADAVVMVEATRAGSDDDRVELLESPLPPGRNIAPRGSIYRQADAILPVGTRIGPAEIGLLAESGHPHVHVRRTPRVALLTTGDEIVPHDRTPGPGRIRNSNGPMLQAALAEAGVEIVSVAHCGDDASRLQASIEEGLAGDVLIVTGGVSAGKVDLVPGCLERAGVRKVFHAISIKPGKPLWFGVRDASHGRQWVFGLPGNPISSLLGFHLFVRLLLDRIQGGTESRPPLTRASLARRFEQRGNRTTFWPFAWVRRGDRVWADPLAWQGSGDLRHVAGCEGWLRFPAGDRTFEAESELSVFLRPR